MKKLTVALAFGALVTTAACSETPTGMLTPDGAPLYAAAFATPQPTYPTSFEGITPDAFPGNFVASDDDQVCYALVALEYIDEVTTEMLGFKVNLPDTSTNAHFDILLSTDLRYLAWEALSGATPVAFIIKGGPNFHVYDYVGTEFDSDSWLASPKTSNGRNIAGISHYNVCYTRDVPEGDQGCTPGYWRNHADRWLGVAPADDFDDTFSDADTTVNFFTPDITLGTAIQLGGGGVNAFARHATGALLNAYGGVANVGDGATVEYPYTVAQVIQMVQDVWNGDLDMEEAKDLFEEANELGCPLSGTRAVPVS
jgi:hypothetical protein